MTGVSGLTGAMRMPAMPATTALIIQLASATLSGETPLTKAPVCDSAVARVSRPKRVYRKPAASSIAITTTVSAR